MNQQVIGCIILMVPSVSLKDETSSVLLRRHKARFPVSAAAVEPAGQARGLSCEPGPPWIHRLRVTCAWAALPLFKSIEKLTKALRKFRDPKVKAHVRSVCAGVF